MIDLKRNKAKEKNIHIGTHTTKGLERNVIEQGLPLGSETGVGRSEAETFTVYFTCLDYSNLPRNIFYFVNNNDK